MNPFAGCNGNITCHFAVAGGMFVFLVTFVFLYKMIGYAIDSLFKNRIERKLLIDEAAKAGYLAFQNSLAMNDNPHQPDSECYNFWNKGYQIAKRKREAARL
jgi:hypothetical protein